MQLDHRVRIEKDEIQIMLHNETEGAVSCSLHDEEK